MFSRRLAFCRLFPYHHRFQLRSFEPPTTLSERDMPGLTNRSAPGGSRKENTNTQRVNVKAEKMAAKSKGQGRRASSKPTGENEDEEDDASDREREGSPKGSKRSRINVAGDSRSRRSSHAEGEDEDDEASADDDDDQGETSGGARRVDSQTLPRDDDGYVIISVFLTPPSPLRYIVLAHCTLLFLTASYLVLSNGFVSKTLSHTTMWNFSPAPT